MLLVLAMIQIPGISLSIPMMQRQEKCITILMEQFLPLVVLLQQAVLIEGRMLILLVVVICQITQLQYLMMRLCSLVSLPLLKYLIFIMGLGAQLLLPFHLPSHHLYLLA